MGRCQGSIDTKPFVRYHHHMNRADSYDYLERLCNLLRVETRAVGAAFGLQPIQLEVLRYLSACNRFSDTPQAVTGYLGQTKGTVSQTLKVLESKGLVTKTADAADRRMVHLNVTSQGRQVLAEAAPPPTIREAFASLSEKDEDRVREGLQVLLKAVQKQHGGKTFAACFTCRFNRESSDGHLCGLTGEKLWDSDLERICREHAFPDL
jgi:DNA-binding MarR family transcriptional regulator